MHIHNTPINGLRNKYFLQEAYRLRIHRKSEIMDRLEQIESDYIAKSTQEYISRIR